MRWTGGRRSAKTSSHRDGEVSGEAAAKWLLEGPQRFGPALGKGSELEPPLVLAVNLLWV